MRKNTVPSVQVRFGGESRLLVFDFNALAELQDLKSTYRGEAPQLKLFRDLVYVGLLAETLDRDGEPTERTLTRKRVGDILMQMEVEEVQALSDQIAKARGVSEPEENPTPASETPATPTA